MDCFAVSLGIGTTGRLSPRSVFRLSFHFGLFQMGMTLAGWLVGSTVERFIAPFDHWIAFGLLFWVGVRMIRAGLNPKEEPEVVADPSRGGTLVLLSVATSLDALAVGLSLAVMEADIFLSSAVVGITSLVLSLVGLAAGNGLGRKFGKRMEIFGGALLILIGLRIVITHLFG